MLRENKSTTRICPKLSDDQIVQFIGVITLVREMILKDGTDVFYSFTDSRSSIILSDFICELIDYFLPLTLVNPLINTAISQNPGLLLEDGNKQENAIGIPGFIKPFSKKTYLSKPAPGSNKQPSVNKRLL